MSKTGATVKDVPISEFIAALASHLKKSGKIELPEWHDIVKTGTHKEMCPQNPDWYYVRAASLARKVYLRGGQGVGLYTRTYGGSASRGAKTERFHQANKGIIRHILQQLEQMDIVATRKDKKGRWVTKNGQRQLDTIAAQVVTKSL